MKENYWDKCFFLNWKKVLLILSAWVLSVLLHNLIYALFYTHFKYPGGDEVFFFIIAVIIIPLYAFISFIYTMIRMIKDKSLFKGEFLIRVLISIILGILIGCLLVEFSFINPMGFWGLAIIFTFLFYYLSKLIIK